MSNRRIGFLAAFLFGVTSLCSGSPCLAQDYPIVDTGQERCYDNRLEIKYPKGGQPFFGQDAHYQGNQSAYRDNGDGTITDLVTRLMWQKDTGPKKTFQEAVAGAAACRTGGYDDWRLPSIKELYSLILFSGEDIDPQATDASGLKPFVNNEYFGFVYGDPAKGERVIDSQMATSTKYVSTTMHGNETMFGVNFADGRIKGYPTGSGGRPGRREKGYYVFYVRGNLKYGKNDFHDNDDGTITDRSTGLTWAKVDSGHLRAGEKKDGKLNWEQALRWAEELEHAGHSDWRLPNAKELQSLVDYTRSPDTTQSAAIDPVFSVTPIRDALGKVNYPFYWSSTTHKRMGSGDTAVYVAFGRSQGWMGGTLMDVHGAGSQRSDPKAGDPSQFPRGRGPQGDVIDIYNMVRPVRGGKADPRETGPELEPQRPGRRGQGPDQQGPGGMGPGRQGGMGPGRQGPGRPLSGDRPGFVSRLDRDGDGRVSRREFDGPADAFDRLDVNHDGYLSESEGPLGPPSGEQPGNPQPRLGSEQGPRDGMAPRQGVGAGSASPFLQRFDRNQDGKVTREEFDGPARRFSTLDRNGDDMVSQEEAGQAGRPGAAQGRPGAQRDRGPGTPRRSQQANPVAAPGLEESTHAVNSGRDVRADADWNKLPPSFVFILVDDMGWTGLSCPIDDRIPDSKSDFYQTPRIDALAQQGLRFSNAYSPSSMCTPSRASILTGKSPALMRMTTPGPSDGQPDDRKLIPPQHIDSLPNSEITIAEVLRRRNYATAHFGKWHLSGGGPGRHGFDQHDGDTENGGAGLGEDPNPKDIFGVSNRAITFMQRQVAAGKPFYVQLSHYAVHGPFKSLDSTMAAYAERPSGTRHRDVEYAAMTHDLDTGVGMVLDSVDRLGITENTYVIFMSDNGAAAPMRSTENQPLSGGKATFWEGGVRVPLIVRGPGIEPDSFCHENVIGFDLFPTFWELADVPSAPHSSVEGTSLVPLWLDRSGGSAFRRDREELVFHFPHYAQGPNQTPQSAILAGNLKLIRFHESNETQLFDLGRDIGEKNDLTKQMPDKAAALVENLEAYLVRVDAQLPSPNPDYDPATAEQASGQRRGRASGRTQAGPRREGGGNRPQPGMRGGQRGGGPGMRPGQGRGGPGAAGGNQRGGQASQGGRPRDRVRPRDIDFNEKFPIGAELPENLEVYNVDRELVPVKSIFQSKYTVIVGGCLTCPEYRNSYPEIEAVARDFKDRGVDFYFLYQSLTHPENWGFVQPSSIEDRFAQVEHAKELFQTQIPWLTDPMENRLKTYFVLTPNSQFVFDRSGKVVHRDSWGRGSSLRESLETLAGKPDTLTTVQDLNLPRFERHLTPESEMLLERVRVDGVAVPLRVESGGQSNPVAALRSINFNQSNRYAKLRPEADQQLMETGTGKLYLGFRQDPVLGASWNNLANPPEYKIVAEGATFSPATGQSKRLEVESDNEPREFLVDVKDWNADKPISVKIQYFACNKEKGWCKSVQQEFTVWLDKEESAGKVSGRSHFPGGGRGAGQAGRGGQRGPGGGQRPGQGN